MRFAFIALAMLLFTFSAQAESDEPFGATVLPTFGNPYTENWLKVRDDWAVERRVLDRCRAERQRCPSPAALRFLAVINEARAQTGRARIAHLNRAINLAIRAMDDLVNYGVPELWTAPLATLARGAGDCTDYAIAKYYALGELGIPATDRRLVFVHTKAPRGNHAVLVVRDGDHWLILDNLRMPLVDSAVSTDYVPFLEFDRNGVWLFIRQLLS
jgi:predicted transglutaminase-like cysteine proteinase